MSSNNVPTFIDLFSGCGGLSLGFLQAGFKCLIAVDNDKKAIDCFNFNLKDRYGTEAIYKDLLEIKNHSHVSDFLSFHDVEQKKCDVLIGGPPCQSFAVVGRNKVRHLIKGNKGTEAYWRKKNRERTTLFEVFSLFVEVIKPRWFLFENVPTIMSHRLFLKILNRFENLRCIGNPEAKYLLEYGKYLASNYELPQDRRRFILIGYRNDIGIKGWLKPQKRKPVNVLEGLDDLPPVSPGNKMRELKYGKKASSAYQRYMRSSKNGIRRGIVYDHICRWHNQDDVQLFSRMSEGAKFADDKVQKSIRDINPNHKLIKYSVNKFRDKLHKLDSERPAWTITAHLQKDCYKFIHYDQPRTITVREAARLQGFPDWFRFEGISMVSSFSLIGNAVPPLFSRAFANSLVTSDRELKSRS